MTRKLLELKGLLFSLRKVRLIGWFDLGAAAVTFFEN